MTVNAVVDATSNAEHGGEAAHAARGQGLAEKERHVGAGRQDQQQACGREGGKDFGCGQEGHGGGVPASIEVMGVDNTVVFSLQNSLNGMAAPRSRMYPGRL
jgi:hypothetical protein